MTTALVTASVLGFGSALVDVLAHVDEDFRASIPGIKGGTELVDSHTMAAIVRRLPQAPRQAPGGSAANTIVGYAKLGGKAALLAKIGLDDAGVFYRQDMQRAGVDTTPFKATGDTDTGRCLSLITPDSERTMRTYMGAAATLRPDELSLDDFRGYSHFYCEGYALFSRELTFRALDLARAAGMVICLDLSAPEVVLAAKDILPVLLRDYVHAVFANEQEAAAFCGSNDPVAGLDALAAHCPLAVLKLGRQGVRLRERGGEVIAVPACSVKAIDSTGAGDLWAAGFLYGWLRGWPLHAAAELGAKVAAAVVQVTGAVIPDDVWTAIRRGLPA